jgi:hypothetical protein
MMDHISPNTIHELWQVFTGTQTNLLLQLSDHELSDRLYAQLHHQYPLSPEEVPLIKAYIHEKTPLFRDLAEARLFAY